MSDSPQRAKRMGAAPASQPPASNSNPQHDALLYLPPPRSGTFSYN
jgi:hypothetical protein